MASKKTAPKTAPAKTTEPTNTSAPTAGENAEVSATGAASAAPQVETKSAPSATPTVTTSETPPAGGSAPTNNDAAKSVGQVVTHLVVHSLVPGFRRGGRAWLTDEVKVSVDDFSAEQLKQIMTEPLLNVLPVAE